VSQLDNPKHVKRKALLERLNEKERLSDIGFVMNHPEGRRMMNDLLKRCGVGRLSFAGPGQSEQTAFYEGQRNIGNYYWSVLTKNFKKEWLIMTDEFEKRESQNSEEAKSNGGTNGNRDPGDDDSDAESNGAAS
jgi:hypothetical protein